MTLDQDTPSNILVANIIKDKQVSIAMTEHGSTVIRVASFKDDSNFSLLSSVLKC